jgi:hypothetical protein
MNLKLKKNLIRSVRGVVIGSQISTEVILLAVSLPSLLVIAVADAARTYTREGTQDILTWLDRLDTDEEEELPTPQEA